MLHSNDKLHSNKIPSPLWEEAKPLTDIKSVKGKGEGKTLLLHFKRELLLFAIDGAKIKTCLTISSASEEKSHLAIMQL